MICLLHRRHFSSTPPGTRRASMLPHRQRKGFTSRVIVAGLILAVLLNHSFLCLAGLFGFLWPSRPKSPQMPEASNLGPPTFPAVGYIPKSGTCAGTNHRRARNPSSGLKLLDPVAGKNKSHNIKESPGGAEKVLQRYAQAELENRENHYQQSHQTCHEAPNHRSTIAFVL